MKIFCLLLSIIATVATGAMNPSSSPSLYLEYGKSAHFSSVGMVEVTSADGVQSDMSTGVLVAAAIDAKQSRHVLTAAHNFDGVPEFGKEKMFFHINGERYKIVEYVLHPEFRKGGPDLAVAILEKEVCATLAVIGNISNDDLDKRVCDGIPSFEEYRQGIEHKTYEFSTAGFGRFGTWDNDYKNFTRDGNKRGFVLSGMSVGLSAPEQFPAVSETVLQFSTLAKNQLSAGATLGSSGSPVFIRNKTIADAKWRIIGVIKSGRRIQGGCTSSVTPINASKWLDGILNQGNEHH